MDAEMIPIGSKLREARELRGTSQSALARRTGVPQPAISRIERGHEAPSVERLSRLLAGLGLRPALEFVPLAEHSGDPAHRAAIEGLSPAERLEQGFGWIELHNELHGKAA